MNNTARQQAQTQIAAFIPCQKGSVAVNNLAISFYHIGLFLQACNQAGWGAKLPDYASHRCQALHAAGLEPVYGPFMGYTGAFDVATPLGRADEVNRP